MFEIVVTASAEDDLASLKKFEQVLILKALPQLTREPDIPARNRKPLEANNLAQWELRLGKYRLFYDLNVEARIVVVKAVGWKSHNRLFIGGKEYEDL